MTRWVSLTMVATLALSGPALAGDDDEIRPTGQRVQGRTPVAVVQPAVGFADPIRPTRAPPNWERPSTRPPPTTPRQPAQRPAFDRPDFRPAPNRPVRQPPNTGMHTQLPPTRRPPVRAPNPSFPTPHVDRPTTKPPVGFNPPDRPSIQRPDRPDFSRPFGDDNRHTELGPKPADVDRRPPTVTRPPPTTTQRPPVVTRKPPVVSRNPPTVTRPPPTSSDRPTYTPPPTHRPPPITERPTREPPVTYRPPRTPHVHDTGCHSHGWDHFNVAYPRAPYAPNYQGVRYSRPTRNNLDLDLGLDDRHHFSVTAGITALHSGYQGIDGGVASPWSDPGAGLMLEWMPAKVLGIELGLIGYDDLRLGDTERTHTAVQGSLIGYAFPEAVVTPYALGGVTHQGRRVDDTYYDGAFDRNFRTDQAVWGPHAGLGLELRAGHFVVNLEGRGIGYVNADRSEAALPGALQTTLALGAMF